MSVVQFTQDLSRGCGMDIHKEVVVATQYKARVFQRKPVAMTLSRDL